MRELELAKQKREGILKNINVLSGKIDAYLDKERIADTAIAAAKIAVDKKQAAIAAFVKGEINEGQYNKVYKEYKDAEEVAEKSRDLKSALPGIISELKKEVEDLENTLSEQEKEIWQALLNMTLQDIRNDLEMKKRLVISWALFWKCTKTFGPGSAIRLPEFFLNAIADISLDSSAIGSILAKIKSENWQLPGGEA